MVSRLRYFVRTHCLGSVKKTSSTRTRGHFSARERLPKYEVTPTCTMVVETPSRVPRYRVPPPGAASWLYFGVKQLVTAAWMNPQPGFVLVHGQVRASEGAEKSCRKPRRRKRGLRRGKRRSRGCHPRRSAEPAANVSKPPNYRKAEHRRRGERWLIVANERLRADAKRFIQTPNWIRGGSDRRSHKMHCVAKWTRLQAHAKELGYPPTMSFDTSFFRWLDKEFPREYGRVDEHALLFRQPFRILGEPEGWDEPQFDPVLALLNQGNPSRNKPRGEGPSEPKNRKGFCRFCGAMYFTPPIHRDCPKRVRK